jgi:hypothetical protein
MIPFTQPIPSTRESPTTPYTDKMSAMTCVPNTTTVNGHEGILFQQKSSVRVEKMMK